jgi:hypothetical protein
MTSSYRLPREGNTFMKNVFVEETDTVYEIGLREFWLLLAITEGSIAH